MKIHTFSRLSVLLLFGMSLDFSTFSCSLTHGGVHTLANTVFCLKRYIRLC